MPRNSGNRLQLRSLPWGLWITSGLFVVIGFLPVFFDDGNKSLLWLSAGGLLLIVLLTKITTFSADRGSGKVMLTNWSPLHGTQIREIPTNDIAQVSIQQTAGRKGPATRVALVLTSAEQVPLTDYYSGGRNANAAAAERLSDFLALDSANAVPVVDGATPRHEQTGSTEGIDWRLETLLAAEGSPIMRWSTTAAGYADGLLILSEINPGWGRLNWDKGLLAEATKSTYRLLLRDYRFKEADVEAIDAVTALPDLDPRLHGCYVAFGSTPDAARGWLSATRVETLARWAAAHPTPLVQPSAGVMLGAVVLLTGPSGLWLVFRGSSQDEACVAEIAQLGVALASATPSPA
jgi:hypothetical protein